MMLIVLVLLLPSVFSLATAHLQRFAKRGTRDGLTKSWLSVLPHFPAGLRQKLPRPFWHKRTRRAPQFIDGEVIACDHGTDRGCVFTANDHFDLGSPSAVYTTLAHGAKAGRILKLAQGLYDYSRIGADGKATHCHRAGRARSGRPQGHAVPALGRTRCTYAWSDRVSAGTDRVLTDGRVAIIEAIKLFQSMGLIGERDIEKKVLEVAIPLFESRMPDHVRLAWLGAEARAEADKVVAAGDLPIPLARHHL